MKYSEFIETCINNIHDNFISEEEKYGESGLQKDNPKNDAHRKQVVSCLTQVLGSNYSKNFIDHIKKGRYIACESTFLDNFKLKNPIIAFYIHVLLQDKHKTFNKGYFDAHIEEMIKRHSQLSLFFIESYYVYLIICKLIELKNLKDKESIRFNNFITINRDFPDNKPKLGINLEGFNSFKEFNGKIVISFYKKGTLLYAKQLKKIGNTENLRLLAYKDRVDVNNMETDEFDELKKVMEKETIEGSEIERFLSSLHLTQDNSSNKTKNEKK